MELPINNKDLETIVNALSLGGDTRLYFLLKGIKEDNQVQYRETDLSSEGVVKIYSESDDYKCKHGECDI
tara:strand:+ start:322 stop:531 length:210 start_codon:yes stop_codon:yes gene_type:complete